HRHSGSKTASVCLQAENGCLDLKIRDWGKGIPIRKQNGERSDAQLGVGIRGMRERLRLLGGTLEIASTPPGVTVHATLPFSRDALSRTQAAARTRQQAGVDPPVQKSV
ncbi:MAG TPA: ATP-binding protein, partial [Candidatus Sulfotelmatobacter sp.]